MKNESVIVKKSNIHGLGVFAARDFKAGEVVLRWDISKKISDSELKKLPSEEKLYVSSINGQNILMQAPEKYVNHSCDANSRSKNFCDIAERNICKGEEITSDYKDGLPEGTSMNCNCGNSDCTGLIKKD